MIISILLDIISFFGKIILNGIIGPVGNIEGITQLSNTIGNFVTIMLQFADQALNFIYFIFGNTMFIVLPVAIGLLIIKYTICPLIIIFRSVIIKGNN